MILLSTIERLVDPLVKMLGENFQWLSSITFGSILIRLLIVIIFSGSIGIERASKRHEAGLRTYILVSVGSCIAMMTNQFIFETYNTGDVARIAAQVVSGIGFLGAGTILVTSRNQIKGLTTAAGLWACACVGIATGIGFYSLGIIAYILIIFVLLFLPPIENNLTKYSKNYKLHIELQSRTDLKLFVTYARDNYMTIQSIERNVAYENSGLSVYTINIVFSAPRDIRKKNPSIDIIKEISNLPYVNHVDNLN